MLDANGNYVYPWNHGEPLTAASLNAAIAQAGLPLSGGTIDPGPLTVSHSSTNAPGVTIAPIGMFDASIPPTPKAWRSTIESITNVGTSGGAYSDATTNAILGVTTIYGAPNNNCWGVTGLLNYSGTGGTGGHVAVVGYGNRLTSAAQPTTTVAATLSAPGNVVSVADVTHFQVPYPMPVVINGTPNMQIGVSGTSGAGTITLVTPVSVADGTSGHTVIGNNNPQIWGANIYAADLTGLDSQHTNTLIGIELDLDCNGLDNGGTVANGVASGLRTNLALIGRKGTAGGANAEIGAAIHAFTDNGVTFKRVLFAEAVFSVAVLDTRSATQQSGAHAVWLGDGQHVAWNSSGTATSYWDSAAFSGAGGVHLNQALQVDGALFVGANASFNSAVTFSGSVGFYGHAAATKPTVTGAKGGNAALTSLMAALSGLGLVTDSTT